MTRFGNAAMYIFWLEGPASCWLCLNIVLAPTCRMEMALEPLCCSGNERVKPIPFSSSYNGKFAEMFVSMNEPFLVP